MNLNSGQERALQAIRDLQKRFPAGGGVLVISGAAGTGKSTVIGAAADEYGSGFLCLAPTGKAALRVRELGCRSKTLHSWMYNPKEDDKTGEVDFVLRTLETVLLPGTGFIVMDESSMLGSALWHPFKRYCQDLGLNIVLVGDGYQLPPVESGAEEPFSVFTPEFQADIKVELTEIHRQALDSLVIRVATAIRTSTWVDEALGDLEMLNYADGVAAAQQLFEDGDGITICHRNTTRTEVNTAVRKALNYFPETLVEAEPLSVTKNNYVLDLYNGEVLTYIKPKPLSTITASDPKKNVSVFTDLSVFDAGNGRRAVVSDREVLGTLGEVGIYFVRKAAQRSIGKLYAGTEKDQRPSYLHTNLGYTITCHRAQGSEWSRGLICLEDSLRLGSSDGRRWIYTAVSRFKDSVRLFHPKR